jgi:uncharacterized protein
MSEQDLAILLRTMEPVWHPEPYGYGVRAGGVLSIEPFATVSEDEGLTAAFAAALGAEGISCNVFAGDHHDNIFVQGDRRGDALAALRRLAIA